MLKAIKGYRQSSRQQLGDEEDPDEPEVQIASDPDLDSPPFGKARIMTAFQQQAPLPPLPARQPSQQRLPSGGNQFASRYEQQAEQVYGFAWKVLINVLIIFPWSCVLLLSWLVNKWQLMFRPVGAAFWWCVDYFDRRLPSTVEWFLWVISQVSLILHVITVGINLGVIWIMWDNGHHALPIFVIAFYGFCHLCTAVTMFKELDMREAGDTYFADVLMLFQRCLDVLFYDIQMVASVVHSNRMLEGMTQVMFKGYEEARVALSALLFSMPCCIIIGIEYGIFMGGKLRKDVLNLDILTSYHDQLYAAVCFSVINSVEKMFRFSAVDPWMHEKNDGFPLLYVRSHAARLPGSVVRDWLVRCKVALAASQGRLVLKELYSHYSQQVKDTSLSLSDPHKAYLLRKAVHYFNTRLLYRPNIDNYPTNKPIIQELIADDIAPGAQLSAMLPDILDDASSLTTLSLAGNGLDDAALRGVMLALAENVDVHLQHLDLSGNQMLPAGAAAVATVLCNNHSIYSLRLAGCPVRDEGAAALAEALKKNISLYKLDLSNCQIGPEGALALADALKVNPVLSSLDMSNTRIGSLGCEALCKALKVAGSSGLKELNLSHLPLDDRAAAAVAGLLASSRVLERLLMTHSNITDAGAQLICNALQNNGTLQFIDVSDGHCMDGSWQKLLNHVVKGKPKA
uniref:Uncharacterized protein n=1 Tax=Tetradesmus obliquus TaxID=3088 RepID=A0A383WCR9_TETOB|eukprot:jgi/Sobl393_1/12272/SZX75418.1